jgi:hypothetical protein
VLSPAPLAIAAATALASPPAPLVDQTFTEPVGGAQICLLEECLPELHGVRNVHLYAAYEGVPATAPEVGATDAPDCTANVNVAFRLRWNGLGPGTLRLHVEFDRTTKNGETVPDSHTRIERDLPLVAGFPVEKDPLLSLCGTLLEKAAGG